MAINFYAGIITKVNNVETVETFVPVNIVKPIPVMGWNDDNAYYYSGYTSELNFMPTNCEVKAFDEEPVELVEVVKILFGIDDSWTENQYKSIFNGNSIINFFSEQNISTKLNFVLRLHSVTYYSADSILGRFQLGDISRAILFYWQSNIDTEHVHNTILTLGEEYSETSFENLLNAGKLIEETNFGGLTYDHFMNYPKYNLFMPMIQTSTDGTYSLAAYNTTQTGINRFAINLSHWANWYTMLTGKYYYGNPYRFELLNPVNGIQYVDLGVPILPNNQLAEGKVFENTVINNEAVPDEYIGFTYYNVGTDLYYLFSHDGVEGTQTVALVNGYLQRVVEVDNVIFRLFVEGKGFEFKNCGVYENARYWDVSLFDIRNTVNAFGSYIMVHKDWATLTVREWLEQIPSDYSQYEYGNNPFFFATYSCGYARLTQIKDNDYFDYEAYPYSRNPGLVTNFHYIDGESEFDMSLCNLEYPIDFEFWETFLTSLIETPSGPNIGGGSIGGGSSGSDGGSGNFDDNSDDVDVNILPSGFTGASNFFEIYTVYDSSLTNIGVWLNTSGIFEAKDKPQGIISVKEIYGPFSRSEMFDMNNGLSVVILGDTVESAIKYNLKTGRYIRKNVGEINIKEYFGNFLDYEPYTKVSIYLPYSGIFDLDINKIINANITLYATLDVLTGCIVYQLKLKKNNLDSVLYTFEGNCGVDIPITSSDYSNRISSAINTGISVASSIASVAAGVVNPAVGAVAGTASVSYGLSSAIFSSPTRTLNSNFNTLSGCMNVQYPYLIINRPIMSLPESYGHTIGYPCNISSNLSSLTGFTVVDEIHLEGFANATQSELDEIETALKQGVLL